MDGDDDDVVFVSGCFDLLHSGHVAFFKQASEHGKVHVSLGSDANIRELKNHDPMFDENERLYMAKGVEYVHSAAICAGMGYLDFEADLDIIKPQKFFVNQDGHRKEKEIACEKRNIEYIVAERIPEEGMEVRSSTAIKASLKNKDKVTQTESTQSPKPPDSNSIETDSADIDIPRLAKQPRERPVVMVSGCYDLLHSGHVAFFKEASKLGDLYVSLGNDANIEQLKHHKSMFPENERCFMVQSIRYVAEARVCRGMGMLDFEADMDILKPDIFFVNEDGHRDSKKEACAKRNIRYIVGARVPDGELP
eukprot:CAMPEP_0204875524 /NCGR_PEP_ID=MMETSP1348-20121228/46164_1 /ASSEMBLY_ACC=CAM_ASM_000700 /TAXON_ID=215587 /ORGANISM="Aplanochytrium stocchinoi, Strain GSBS06" /LENGTH=307 /DNA_ID=CAMNT_0052032011 /DNA_START=156 /DNA_END=1075 /DNA_ORIENTATION=-